MADIFKSLLECSGFIKESNSNSQYSIDKEKLDLLNTAIQILNTLDN